MHRPGPFCVWPRADLTFPYLDPFMAETSIHTKQNKDCETR